MPSNRRRAKAALSGFRLVAPATPPSAVTATTKTAQHRDTQQQVELAESHVQFHHSVIPRLSHNERTWVMSNSGLTLLEVLVVLLLVLVILFALGTLR